MQTVREPIQQRHIASQKSSIPSQVWETWCQTFLGKYQWKLASLLSMGVLFLAGCVSLEALPVSTMSENNLSQEAASESQAAIEENDAATAEPKFLDLEILEASDPPFGTRNWATDFSKRTVTWDSILSGGPPKDGIPAIDNPTFESIADASDRVGEREPVIVFGHNDVYRAYPLSILIWHEIVNDEIAGKPVSVTFCPLCNASIVFDRQFGEHLLDFGTTGKLRNSDLIMYDRQTETWWQQFTGQGIVGELVNAQLAFLPSQVLSFGDFVEQHPDGEVLAIPSQFNRNYGANPYVSYDSSTNPFLFRGEIDPRLSATERVVGIELGETVMAYAFADAAEAGVINDTVADEEIVVFHKDGTASALDGRSIADSRDVGSVGVFSRHVDGQTLIFTTNDDGTFTDAETGSTWNISGLALDGELSGTQLESIISFDHFWFAWAAFHPDTELWQS